MDEGFGQLLLFLFFLAAAVFDAIGRGRTRRRRMEEMEREEEALEVDALSAESPGPMEGARGEEEAESPRRTAEVLIPDDLWAILTGGAPRPGTPPPPAEDIPAEEPSVPAGVREEEPVAEWGETTWGSSEEEFPWRPLAVEPRPMPVLPPPPLPPAPARGFSPERRSSGEGVGSDYARRLRSGNVSDLRAAIVLREVLGPPVALRRPGEMGWEDRG